MNKFTKWACQQLLTIDEISEYHPLFDEALKTQTPQDLAVLMRAHRINAESANDEFSKSSIMMGDDAQIDVRIKWGLWMLLAPDAGLLQANYKALGFLEIWSYYKGNDNAVYELAELVMSES